MIQIGIHNTGYFSSCAIFIDGDLVYATAEERLSRIKFDNQFPFKAIEAGLKLHRLSWDDVDEFLIAWNPAVNASDRYRPGFSRWVSHPMQRLYSNINAILPKIGSDVVGDTEQNIILCNKQISVKYINHHNAHIGMSYFSSGFAESAIFIADGYGENSSTVFALANEQKITILKEIKFPHSLGMFYATFTEFLGFEPEKDEWKVMGAAAYGSADKYYGIIKSTILDYADGNFELDLNYFNYYNYDSSGYYSEKMRALIGSPDVLFEDEQNLFDFAASVQAVFEEVAASMLSWLYAKTQMDNLCMGGGTAMNCLFNGKIELKTDFKNVYIPFSPDDIGNSIGAVLWRNKKMLPHINSYQGEVFGADKIEQVLDAYKIKYTKIEWAELYSSVAKLLANGCIVGWFQDGSEFGQRALGNRSILADPRSAKMKDTVNAVIKYREGFRPFAPAILDEFGRDYFVKYRFTPNMERILQFRPEKKNSILAVVHNDGTGRLQSVRESENKKFYALLYSFYKETGMPILLNTSFNVAGEPIVYSPADAIRTFYSSGLDVLVLENYLILKEKQ